MTTINLATDSLRGFGEIANTRFQWRGRSWMIGLLLIIIASIVSSLSYTAKADRDVDRQFAAKLNLYREQGQRISELESLQSEEVNLAAQAVIDASLIDAVPFSRLLAEVDSALVGGVRLLGITLDAVPQPAQGLATSSSMSAGVSAQRILDINGEGSDDSQISRFIARLGKSPWFDSVKVLPDATPSASTLPRRFQVQLTLGGGANAPEARLKR